MLNTDNYSLCDLTNTRGCTVSGCKFNNSNSYNNYGVLSDRQIRQEIKNGNIVLYDPVRDTSFNIQNCSVDITLGENYYSNDNPIMVFNPWNVNHVHKYWGKHKTANVIENQQESDFYTLPIGTKYIPLKPNESILAHTNEYIGGRNYITTMMKARSSMGRSNVTICRDAGWGDIGYISRWTLEITNNSSSLIVLPVCSRIGQLIFFYTGIPDSHYNGKYQTHNDLNLIVKSWTPETMLPKLNLDK